MTERICKGKDPDKEFMHQYLAGFYSLERNNQLLLMAFMDQVLKNNKDRQSEQYS